MSYDSLPGEIWLLIGSKLGFIDRIRFRAVSKACNSLLPARHPPLLMLSEEEEEFFPPPWLMLEEDEAAEKEEAVSVYPPPRRGFVGLGGHQQILEMEFPEAHQARVVGSTGNWLITMHLNKTLRILNPFSRHQFCLPPRTTLEGGEYLEAEDIDPEVYRDTFVHKIVLSSSPDKQDCFAMAIYHLRVLAIARPGDVSWTTLLTPYSPVVRKLFINDVIFYKKEFYAVDKDGKLIICDTEDSSSPPKLVYVNDGIKINYRDPKIYLVEWAGELLLVIKIVDNFEDPDDYKTNGFQLYKLDSESNEWNELKNLGDYSLFLGLNTSVSVLASDYFGVVKRNCIYFTDDYTFGYRGNQIPGGRDMGVFDLENNSITPHFRGISTSLYSPPVWIIPS